MPRDTGCHGASAHCIADTIYGIMNGHLRLPVTKSSGTLNTRLLNDGIIIIILCETLSLHSSLLISFISTRLELTDHFQVEWNDKHAELQRKYV